MCLRNCNCHECFLGHILSRGSSFRNEQHTGYTDNPQASYSIFLIWHKAIEVVFLFSLIFSFMSFNYSVIPSNKKKKKIESIYTLYLELALTEISKEKQDRVVSIQISNMFCLLFYFILFYSSYLLQEHAREF